EDLLARERKAGPFGEVPQQVELLRRELDRVTGDAHLAPAGIDGDLADLHDFGRRAAVDTPQDRLHARDELCGGERLREVVVAAELEADDAVDLAVPGGEEDDGNVRRAARALARLEAVDVGQADVEHDEPGPVVPDRLQPALAGAGFQHPEALAGEVEVDEVGDVGLVVDDDDRPLLILHHAHGPISRPDAYLDYAMRSSGTHQGNVSPRQRRLCRRAARAGACDGDRLPVEAVGAADVPEPAAARLHGASLSLAVDGHEPECRAVAERPLEVVEQGPVEVAAHVDAVVETAADAPQRLGYVLHALVVVGGANPVLGHVDRRAGGVVRAPDRRLERPGPELVSHLQGRDALGRPEQAVGTKPQPGVGLHTDVGVAAAGVEPDVLHPVACPGHLRL